jgi:HAD superfamily hydrolase (TIGR01549 family)
MKQIEGVVLDLDGTIVDTFEHIVRAFEVVLPQHDVQPDRELIRQIVGLTLVDCYRALAPGGDHGAMTRLHHETQQAPHMYELIVAYEGLREAVETLQEQERRVAVLTNRSRESVDLIFNYLGIADLFDMIVTFDDIGVKKPDPGGIQHIAEQWGVSPESLVMVGDTTIDVETARAAQMRAVIGISHGFGTRQELETAGADYIIDSLVDLPQTVAIIEQS